MQLSQLLSADSIVPALKAGSKKQVLQEAAAKLENVTGLSQQEVFEGLFQREKLGSTGAGHGVAIPHARFPSLEEIYGAFVRLEKPVDFDAVDDQPVDLVFALLAPEDAGADHLKALAKISRLLRDNKICEKLRGTEDPEALYAIMTESELNGSSQ